LLAAAVALRRGKIIKNCVKKTFLKEEKICYNMVYFKPIVRITFEIYAGEKPTFQKGA